MTKACKAILIDPTTRTVSEVEYTGDYRNIYEHLGADLFTCVQLSPHGDTAYVDDEGLLNGTSDFFWLPDLYPDPLAGNGLVLGTDKHGDSIAPQELTVEQLRTSVRWLIGVQGLGLVEISKENKS